MTHYDHAVLAFYFVFMLVISWVFRRFITNVSDYFRSGGQVLWWMAGGSAFMVSFSAWTFTGAASRAYLDGWPVAVIYLANAIGFFINAAWFGPKFRQLRVITSMEAVKQRFGRASEQTFTWITMPLQMLTAGIWLYGLGVFFSAAFDIDVRLTIAVTALAKLTRRELQVLKMIGDGYSAAAIADQLFRSKRTIQWHRASLGRKLGVTNRVMLAQIAYAAGLPEFDVDQVYDLLHNRKRTKKRKPFDPSHDGKVRSD